MAVELASAYVSIVPTTKGIGAQLERELSGPLNAAAKSAGDGATKSLQQTSASFTKFGIGALAVAGVVGAGLLKTGQSASNLGESINAVNVTFGKSAAGILKLGEDAAKSVGLSNTAFNGLAVQFSSFAETIAGKGGDVVGTIDEMTGRAADFASVMNIDVAEAARLFQSGLAGETEPLKKFGIDLSAAAVNAYAAANGIGAVGAQLTESEKVTARYGLLMESTSKTQGDFANTADSAANATRIAKAEMENASASLGESLTPAMAFAATTVASLAGGFSNLNDATGGWLAKGAGIAVLALGTAGAVSLVVGQVFKFRVALTTMHSALVDTEGGLTGIGKAAKYASIGLGLAAAGLAAYNFQQHHDAEQAEAVRKALDEVTRASDENAASIVHGLIVAWRRFDDLNPDQIVEKLARENLAAAVTTRDLASTSVEARAKLEGQGITVAMLTRAIDGETAAQVKSQDASTKATAAIDEQTAAIDEAIPVIDHGTIGIENLNEQLAFQQQRATDAARATDELRLAQFAALGNTGDYAQSIRDLDTAYYDLQTQLFENAVMQRDATLADRDKEQSTRDVATAQHDMASEVAASAEKYADEAVALDGSKNKTDLMRDSLQLARAKYPELRAEIDLYIAKLNEIQPSVSTKVLLKFASVVGGMQTAASGTPPGGSPGGWTVVGEEGPELVNLPRGADVYTAYDSRQMASSNAALMAATAGGSIPPIVIHNNRRDIGVGDLNQVLAMARLAA